MNERLNFEKAGPIVLSPGSESELSKLLDIDDYEEDESQRSVSVISICCFSFTVSFTLHYCCFAYYLWCLASRSSI